jgi:hypothetical protein
MTAAVWCPDHDPDKTIIHPLTEVDPITQEVNPPQGPAGPRLFYFLDFNE